MRRVPMLRCARNVLPLSLILLAAASLPNAMAVTSFGDATIFKSRADLDQAALPLVVPANDHLFILGNGIDNGGFALFTDVASGFQLGLRAKERFLNNFLPNNGVDTYNATPGESSPGLATWNFDFHVDLGANLAPLVPSGDVKAPGPLTPTGLIASVLLDMDFDPGVGLTNFVTFDLVVSAIVNGGATNPLLIQDSQNLGFAFWQGPPFNAPPFDPNALGEYTFRLRALDALGQEQGRVTIQVEVNPPVAVESRSWEAVKQLYR